jgi:hypothetical protein
MCIRQILRKMPLSAFFLTLGLFFLTACGSNTATGGTTSTLSATSATATACARLVGTRTVSNFSTAIGTLKSINGPTLVVTNQQGTDLTVTYSSSTRFTQESLVGATSLQEGTSVRVTVASTNGGYTATTITVVDTTAGSGSGFPGFNRGNGTPGAGRGGNGSNPCFNRGQFGTPGAFSGTPGTTFRGISGTVSQVTGGLMVITDSAGSSYSVTINAQTQTMATKSVTSAALKVGEPLTVVGTSKNGTIAANTVAILLSLPTTRARTPTPTP